MKIRKLLKSLALIIPFTRSYYIELYIRRTNLSNVIWGGGIFIDEINKYLDLKLTENERKNARLLRRILKDIVYSYIRYGATPQEYFMFGFRNQKHSYRKRYLTNRHKDEVMIRVEGLRSLNDDLENKNNFYQKFKHFFNREVLLLNNETHDSDLKQFVRKHSRFIAKPINGQCGKGIEIIDITEGNSDRVFHDLVEKGDFLLEELIIQDDRMAEWNGTSVNTVRMPTFIKDNAFIVLKPFFRTGRRGSVVDNGGSGGVFSMIDERTGELITEGYDENGRRYECHPDSGCKYKGWVIPRWNELLTLAEECHRNFYGHRYVGWDFALTKDGWVLIEGNWGQFLSEFTEGGGIRKQFDNLMK